MVRGNIDYNDKQGKTNKAAASWNSESITSQLKASFPGIFTILTSGEATRIDHAMRNEPSITLQSIALQSLCNQQTNDKKQGRSKDDKMLLLFFCLT